LKGNIVEEESYRVPQHRKRRTLAEEISRFSLCFALSEHGEAPEMKGRSRALSGLGIGDIKTGILGETIRAGDEVEGEAIASGFACIYQPRAYYPPYLLGEMRAALRRGESPPAASPHYLPVSLPPRLPDGYSISFLYGTGKTAFDRPDFPSNVRDVLTREYMRMPLLVPPDREMLEGRVHFRARLFQLDRDSVFRLAGVGENSYQTYSTRGLTYFLRPIEIEESAGEVSLRGSVFTELSLIEEPGWERVTETLEKTARATVEEVFPACPRGERQEPGCYLPHSGFHVTRFRRRLFAMVFDPVIVIFRAPRLLGLYLPGEMMGGIEGAASLFEQFVLRFSSAIEKSLGLASPPAVEMAYDSRLPWARERGVLRGPEFDLLAEKYPFLTPTIGWLRGDDIRADA
jgi:hypothetical protein